MVKYAEILKNNAKLQSSSNLTAVFVGATNGIGLGALRAFAKHTAGTSPTIYIVGRSSASLEKLISSLTQLNSTARFVPVQANDLTLIKDAQTAANVIAQDAQKVDLLILSPGYVSGGREESPEGLDRVQAIRFYSRMRFLITLAPHLRKSSNPRVVTVLGSGLEGQLWPEDWRLKDHYSLPKAAGASGSLTTLFLEEFAKKPENEKISLVHLYPGAVAGTGLQITGLNFILQAIVDWFVFPVVFRLIGSSVEEAGERVLFAATDSRFGRRTAGIEGGELEKGSDGQVGSGVYLAQPNSSVVTDKDNKILKEYHDNGMGEKVWAHTLEEFSLVERS